MGAMSACCRVLLIIINIFFLVIGLVFFALGLFIRFGSSILNDYTDTVKKSIEESASQSGYGKVTLDFDIADILFGVAIAFICFGLFLLIITFLGCCGACCKQRGMLIVYLVVCVVLLVGQLIVIGILYGSPDTFDLTELEDPRTQLGNLSGLMKGQCLQFHDPAKMRLKADIQTDYMGLNGTNMNSMAWNIVMQKVECCGPISYDDFTGATNWIVNYGAIKLKTPLACCIQLPSSLDYSCASTLGATDANNYQSVSCYDKIWDMTLGNTAIMVGTLVGVGVFQLAMILAGAYLIVVARANKTVPSKMDF